MNLLQAAVLAIVQGIAEFLPISSSGHLVLLHGFFESVNEDWTIPLEYQFTFDIMVHLGTLVAIIVAFRADILALIKEPFSKMTGLLIVGSLPVMVVGFTIRDPIINNLRTGIWLAAAFTVTGFLLVAADKFTKGVKTERDISWLDALIIGCTQALALPPGISRSGTTITGGLARGLNRESATKFSFMLALIAIGGVSLLESYSMARGEGAAIETIGVAPIIVGLVVSAVVGFLAIKLLLKLIKSCKLRYFSYYLWGVAAFLLVDYLFLGVFS
jgi:undecaprenyl-diphosphatase